MEDSSLYEKRRSRLAAVMREANRAKADGSALFVSDLHPAGMLYGAIVRAPYAHSRILRVDATAALQTPDVAAVLTAADLPGIRWFGSGFEQDQQILAETETFSYYDAVALVAARTREAALAAARRVAVEAEPLADVFDPEAALLPDAPVLRGESNLLQSYHYVRGEWREAEAGAATVVSATFRVPPIEHSYLETDCALAWCEPDGDVHVAVGCHNVYKERRTVAAVLGIPEARVFVTQPYTGGSFGGKDDGLFSAYAALLARATHRPVRVQAERGDEFVAHTKRHPQRIRMSMAFDADGRIRGIRADILADTGSAAHVGSAIFKFVSVNATGPYRVPCADIHTRVVYTNQVAFGAMRSWGMTGLTFAVETLVNMAAERLCADPLVLRRMNAIRDGDALLCGRAVPAGARYAACLESMRAFPLSGAMPAALNGARYRYGVGYAGCFQGSNLHFGHPDRSECRLRAQPDGTITVEIAASDIGQGLEATLIAIVSETLGGHPVAKIRYARPDTENPAGGPTGASRQTTMSGSAAYFACRQLIALANALAAQALECPAEQIHFSEGLFEAPGGRSVPLQKLLSSLREPLTASGCFDGVPTTAPDARGYGFPVNQYGYGVQRAEVAVDLLTGCVRVLALSAIHDGGHIVNPTGAEGQIQGAIAQGLGMALMEDCRYRDGKPLQRGFTDYLIPTAPDTPKIDVMFLDEPVPMGPLGVKGLAEVGVTPTAPAIIAAIHDAAGVWLTDLPATPARVLKALSEGNK